MQGKSGAFGWGLSLIRGGFVGIWFGVMTYLAVPIAGKDLGEGRRQIEAAAAGGAEMVELRMDYVAGLGAGMVAELVGAVKAAGLPVIVTCRDVREGGAIDYPAELRAEALVAGLKAGADFADIEYENFCRPGVKERIGGAAVESGGRLILSAHNFEGKLEDMGVLYRHIEKAWAGCVPKLVYKAEHINDCFEAFDLLHETSGEGIVLCMGGAGVISRILAKKFGCLVTFASVREGKGTAPGQLTVEELRGVYRYEAIDEGTELYGVIGAPVGHSVSPAAHNACFGAAGMNRLYLPLLVEGGRAEFGAFMDGVLARPWLGFRGFSVTIPHKAHAMDYVTRGGGFVESLAAKIGAVNTVTIGANGRVSGYNTDYAGARDALCAALGVKEHGLHGMRVAVLGAGGVARAVVAGLADAAAKVTIYNRTVAKAAALGEEFGCRYAGLEEIEGMEAEVVINCTSIGMYPEVEGTPLAKEYIREGMTVFDTVYNPVETRLLREAKEAGATTIDGVSMFVRQAMAQFELFAGSEADGEVMREAISRQLVCSDAD